MLSFKFLGTKTGMPLQISYVSFLLSYLNSTVTQRASLFLSNEYITTFRIHILSC